MNIIYNIMETYKNLIDLAFSNAENNISKITQDIITPTGKKNETKLFKDKPFYINK